MKFITQFSRIFVGVLFIISGLIKANDTLGFSYKLLEYFELFNMRFLDPYAVGLSMVICIFEVVSGIALLLGIYTRLNAWLLLLLIAFFTLLTGYSAITHKVTDCGCFGDALKLTPFTSFMKDVVLLVLILVIFVGHKHIQPLFNAALSHIGLFISLLVSTAFTIYTFMFMPVKDFLPYKIGNDIYSLTLIPEGAPRDEIEMLFQYEKDGKIYEFTAAQLPEDIENYNFIDRKDKVIKEGYKAPIHDFKLFDEAGIDYTDSLFLAKGYQLLLVQTKIEESRKGTDAKLVEIYNACKEKGIGFWALTASNMEEVKTYANQNKLPYTFYSMDAIPLKSMVRSNPGVILLKDNVVVKKWGAYNLPGIETLTKYIH